VPGRVRAKRAIPSSVFTAAASDAKTKQSRDRGFAMAALCVGGMVLARTIDDEALANRIREASRALARDLITPKCAQRSAA